MSRLLVSAVFLLGGCALRIEVRKPDAEYQQQLEALAKQLSDNDRMLAQKIAELSKKEKK